MSLAYSSALDTAKDYYNCEDSDNFYYKIWGGEDIHIGLYESEEEPIPVASRRTVEYLASLPESLDANIKVLDMGSGFCGAARFLAATSGCEVIAINLSEVQNERAREMNEVQGLDHLIEVVDGNFEDVPAGDNTFDLVWSQDAILHSGDRARVLAEAVRVLKPSGNIVFTDPMQSDDCPEGVLQPILERIHLESLGSPDYYRETAREAGLDEVRFEDLTHQLVIHYTRVLEETKRRGEELREVVSQDYIDRMEKGLGYWIDGGKKGYLVWGIFQFRHP